MSPPMEDAAGDDSVRLPPVTGRLARFGPPLVASLGLVLLLASTLSARTVNWREADVLMVGRNACRGVSTLFFPRIDHQGAEPRITGMELPLLNQAAASFACGGPGQVLAARLLNLALGVLGVFAWWSFIRRRLSPPGAWVALVTLTFSPIYFFYARTIQPDVPSLVAGLVALALMDLALPDARPTRWAVYVASAGAMAVGGLVKVPVLVFGLPLLVLLVERRWAEVREAAGARRWLLVSGYATYAPLALGAPMAWLQHARHLQEAYGVRYFFLGDGLASLAKSWVDPSFYWRIYGQSLFDSYAFPLVSALACAFLIVAWRRAPKVLRALAVATVAFFFLAGESAAWHTSYGLIAVPAIAWAAGAGFDLVQARAPALRGPLAVGVVVASVVGYGFWRTRGWRTPREAIESLDLAKALLDQHAPGAALFVVSDGDPKMFWYLDRRGEIVPPSVGRERLGPVPLAPVAIDVTRMRGADLETARAGLARLALVPLAQRVEVELWVPGGG